VKQYLYIALWILAFLILPQPAHANRLPEPKQIQTLTQKFFNRYGKTYPETVFGQHNLNKVQINSVREISYHVAYADLVLLFKDGKMGRSLVKITKKFPKGWRVTSWEILQLQGQ
jgi:RecB family exonuclease